MAEFSGTGSLSPSVCNKMWNDFAVVCVVPKLLLCFNYSLLYPILLLHFSRHLSAVCNLPLPGKLFSKQQKECVVQQSKVSTEITFRVNFVISICDGVSIGMFLYNTVCFMFQTTMWLGSILCSTSTCRGHNGHLLL